ncbi:hypothetical protein KAU88_01665 [Candidatus Bathyarchaeota archaeon]|nr:hypothetical protein [Candidatus Bathyarchaeota archaeon]
MTESRSQESLKKIAQVIESLDLDRRVAAAKWLEGVIVAQILTTEERGDVVKAANEYIATVEEEETVDAVNALIEYLKRTQRSANRALKKTINKHPTKKRIYANNPLQ